VPWWLGEGTLSAAAAQQVSHAQEIADLALTLIGHRSECFMGEHWFDCPSLCRLCRQRIA
jgi:hypothetical protein